ncbi:cyanidin 3-O-glucoside 7-O-glucosyltransferase (acyl-glucose)-like [Coffea eugenioides]|uniref:cyanidin 3-O-glucoside 7-O-glucosyltransferase (acyl-glucose)-like n=1 Tax=Coffea eugenioides TaxID=49369 RepID=UPI000F60D7B7|nr:cyanidin 3-O-glucoside 7-O-glucosyltransferase (acyl-glucose)-like [Coffea eugenioides]
MLKQKQRSLMYFTSAPLILVLMVLMLLQSLAVMVVARVENYTRSDFPADFVFGAGTASYQVEGAALDDGRTPSIWDTYTHANKGLSNGATGDIACDQYHKYKEDVQRMVETGLEAYRFSISWSRLIPNGRGHVNPKGLEYYNNLINELLMHGIQPHVTLVHLDNPQALEDEYGGWLSRKMVRDFTAYADLCFKEFGDRVLHWTTINEANVFAIGGYDNGLAPPGRCSPPFGLTCTEGDSSTEPYIAGHNMLLAHSSVVKLYYAKYKAIQRGFVGLNLYAPWFSPYSKAVADVIATKRAIDYYIGWFLHPLVFGDYPDIIKKNAGKRIPTLTPRESKLIKGSIDFIGLNHYFIFYVKDNPSNLSRNIRDITADMAVSIFLEPEDATTDQDEVESSSLFAILEYLKKVYANPPIYIQENGKGMERNGTLIDTPRVKYVHSYIGALLDAIKNGSNTKGYFLWSFLDGLELLGGYQTGYGLYYVDLDDKQLRRYPKLSAHWYSNFLKGRSIRPDEIIVDGNEAFVSSMSEASDH